MNLVQGLTEQILRVTEIRRIYLELEANAGRFAAGMMQASIENAKQAQESGDVVEMMKALKDLLTYEL